MAGIFNGVVWAVLWLVAIGFSLGTALVVFVPYLLLVFAGGGKRHEKALANLDTVLMSGEDVTAKSVQVRIFSLWSRRSLVAITNSRLIVLKRGLLGGFKMQDIQWRDLKDGNRPVKPVLRTLSPERSSMA